MLSARRWQPLCTPMGALRPLWRRQVGFTYPGASRQQLSDVNVRVALSSRIAVLGANGAGKARTLCCTCCVGSGLPATYLHLSLAGQQTQRASPGPCFSTAMACCAHNICPGLTRGVAAHSPRSSSSPLLEPALAGQQTQRARYVLQAPGAVAAAQRWHAVHILYAQA